MIICTIIIDFDVKLQSRKDRQCWETKFDQVVIKPVRFFDNYNDFSQNKRKLTCKVKKILLMSLSNILKGEDN